MSVREQLLAQAPSGEATAADLTAAASESRPAIARVDDSYAIADVARLFNRFNRDTVESLGAIIEALNALESRVAALESQE